MFTLRKQAIEHVNLYLSLFLVGLHTGFAKIIRTLIHFYQWRSVASILQCTCTGHGLIVLDSCSSVVFSVAGQVILSDSSLSLCPLPICVIDLTAQRFICQCGCRDLITWGLFHTPIPVGELSKHIPPKQPPSCPKTTKGDSYFSC